ncbi:alpha/beta hydrolase (plasmid) [Rhodococcoides fascians A21d2]|uniref:alpha/beta fold hydrolase n=1 Tax=Rhodococcoides fascians TaxID=1828 RepID=UPI00068DE9A1|nr:alpha/beta hydrolase [Rhodococcus fascians]QII03689.1 alpha/beta hydrolase [Rhodococcus fascians A21d2]
MKDAAAASAATQDIDSRFITVGGVRLHYKRAGVGAPILLLHGTGSSLGTWDRVVESLAGGYDIVRVDLPGFGLTGPRPDRDYTISTFVEVITGLIDQLALGPTVIVGNSLGGNIAWNVALNVPDRVAALVLINATGYPSKKLPVAMRLARNPIGRILLRSASTRGAIRRNLRATVGPATHSAVTEELVARVHAMMTRPGNRQAFIDLSRVDQPDRTERLRDIAAPTLVLTSEAVGPQGFGIAIPGAREVVNPGTGHLVPDEDPTWVADEIGSFLDSLNATAEDRDRP